PSLDKERILSMGNLAGFYAELGSWERARSLYRRIVGLDFAHIHPDIFVHAVQNLVSLFDLNEQPDSANILLNLPAYLRVIPPGSPLAFRHQFYRARVYRKLQAYETAQHEFDTLLAALAGRRTPELETLFIQSLQEQG